LFDLIEESLETFEEENREISKIKEIVLKLQKGQKFLGASAKIMEYLIQDLLDYS